MEKFQLVFTEKEIQDTAEKFLQILSGYRHFSFYGPMGAGKTTFIKALCNLLGANDQVSSPTFAIVNEYFTQDRLSIYHFDFYRIKSIVELLDIGFDEYCRDDVYCFIEWPEKGEALIPHDFIKVSLTEQSNGKRILTI
jgi:tRNA threonylcarbamoyladenosine biosynthesis protein TsaE